MNKNHDLYKNYIFLTAVCWANVACWLLIGGFCIGIVAYNLGLKVDILVENGELLFYSMIGSLVIAVASLFCFRCPHCGRLFLIETWESKHPSASKRNGVNYFGSVIIDVLLLKKFTCMYCGTGYLTKKKSCT